MRTLIFVMLTVIGFATTASSAVRAEGLLREYNGRVHYVAPVYKPVSVSTGVPSWSKKAKRASFKKLKQSPFAFISVQPYKTAAPDHVRLRVLYYFELSGGVPHTYATDVYVPIGPQRLSAEEWYYYESKAGYTLVLNTDVPGIYFPMLKKTSVNAKQLEARDKGLNITALLIVIASVAFVAALMWGIRDDNQRLE